MFWNKKESWSQENIYSRAEMRWKIQQVLLSKPNTWNEQIVQELSTTDSRLFVELEDPSNNNFHTTGATKQIRNKSSRDDRRHQSNV